MSDKPDTEAARYKGLRKAVDASPWVLPGTGVIAWGRRTSTPELGSGMRSATYLLKPGAPDEVLEQLARATAPCTATREEREGGDLIKLTFEAEDSRA